jgi:DNA mismatch endonuclease (patch repair protein)
MPDKISKERRSENMRAIRSKDMKPELIVRKLVHRLGYRYRLHRKDLPGKPDLAFGPLQKAIFVHGCFWHQHSRTECLDGRMPKSNMGYWELKFRRNIERDANNQRLLRNQGWDTMVIWECDLRDQSSVIKKIVEFLGPK